MTAAPNIISLPRPGITLGSGSASERIIGTKKSGPRGIEAVLMYNGLTMNVTEWVDTYLITNINGIDDADVRDSRDLNPGDHGETPFNSYYGGRSIVLTGKIVAKTIWKLRDMQQALRAAFADISTEMPLIFMTGDINTDLYIPCKKVQPIQMPDAQKTANHFERDFNITLRASNPRFLSSVRVRSNISLYDLRTFVSGDLETLEDFSTESSLSSNAYQRDGDAYEIVNGIYIPKAIRRNLAPNPSAEVNLAGWEHYGGGVLERSNTWKASGGWAFRLSGTPGASQDFGANTLAMPVEPGKAYSAAATLHPVAVPGFVRALLVFKNAGGGSVGAYSVDTATGITQDQRVKVEGAVAPANAVGVEFIINMWAIGAVVNDIYFDAVTFAEGATAPLIYGDGSSPGWIWEGAPHASVSRQIATLANLLKNPAAEVNSDDGGWVVVHAGGAPVLARTTDQQKSGAGGFSMTSTIAGDISLRNVNVRFPVTVGMVYSAAAEFKTPAGARDVTVFIDFYDATGTRVSAIQGLTVPAGPAGYTRAKVENATAPAGAVTAQIIASANVPGAETVYVDELIVVEGSKVPPYFDGSTIGFAWDSVSHNSASYGPFGIKNVVAIPDFDVQGTWQPHHGTLSIRSNSGALDNGPFARVVYDGVGANGGLRYDFSAIPSQAYSATGYFRSPTAPRPAVIEIDWFDANGVFISAAGSQEVLVDDEWTQVVFQNTVAPANAATGSAYILYYDLNTGDLMDGDKMLVVPSATLPDPLYFDGDSFAAEWAGTPNESESVLYGSTRYLTTRKFTDSQSVIKFTTPSALSSSTDVVRILLAYRDDDNMVFAALMKDRKIGVYKRENGVLTSLVESPAAVAFNPSTNYWLLGRLKDGKAFAEFWTSDPYAALPAGPVESRSYTLSTAEVASYEKTGMSIGMMFQISGAKLVFDDWRYEQMDTPTGWKYYRGAGTVVSRNGSLRPLDKTQKLLVRSGLPYEVGSATLVKKIRWDDPIPAGETLRVGTAGKVLDNGNFIAARLDQPQAGTAGTLYLLRFDGNVETVLSSIVIPANVLVPDTDYWIQLVMNGDTFSASLWTTNPSLGGAAAYLASPVTLAGTVKDKFGAAVKGEVGIYWQSPTPLTSSVDDFIVTFTAFDDIAFESYNEGDFDAQPMIELDGPMTNPIITNEANDTSTIINGVIPDGETWVIDPANKTMVRRSDKANRFNYLDTDSEWLTLVPENNNIRLTASGLGANSNFALYHHHTYI